MERELAEASTLRDDSNSFFSGFNVPPPIEDRLDDTDEFLEDLNDEQFAHRKMA